MKTENFQTRAASQVDTTEGKPWFSPQPPRKGQRGVRNSSTPTGALWEGPGARGQGPGPGSGGRSSCPPRSLPQRCQERPWEPGRALAGGSHTATSHRDGVRVERVNRSPLGEEATTGNTRSDGREAGGDNQQNHGLVQ